MDLGYYNDVVAAVLKKEETCDQKAGKQMHSLTKGITLKCNSTV